MPMLSSVLSALGNCVVESELKIQLSTASGETDFSLISQHGDVRLVRNPSRKVDRVSVLARIAK